jgi:hypothetical protein
MFRCEHASHLLYERSTYEGPGVYQALDNNCTGAAGRTNDEDERLLLRCGHEGMLMALCLVSRGSYTPKGRGRPTPPGWQGCCGEKAPRRGLPRVDISPLLHVC